GLTAGSQAAPAASCGAASDKLRLACVGVGGQGQSDMGEFKKLADVNIVALCDVDAEKLAAAAKEFPEATKHRDFRKLFESEKDFDAVLVATPDHTHAVITMAALKHHKHVYCEKPLTRTVH